jgi:hypothetical protein
MKASEFNHSTKDIIKFGGHYRRHNYQIGKDLENLG